VNFSRLGIKGLRYLRLRYRLGEVCNGSVNLVLVGIHKAALNLLGQPIEKVVNKDAMANPGCLDWYVAFAAQRHAAGGGQPG